MNTINENKGVIFLQSPGVSLPNFKNMLERDFLDIHEQSSQSPRKSVIVESPNAKILQLLKKTTQTEIIAQNKWYTKIFSVFRLGKSKSSKIKPIKKKIDPEHVNLKLVRSAKPREFTIFKPNINASIKKKSKRNFLVIVWLVKKFIQIIKTFTYMKKIFRLQNYHFNAIGDSSNFYLKGSEFGENFFSNLNNRTSQNYDREAENIRMKKFFKVLKNNSPSLSDFTAKIKTIVRNFPILMPDSFKKLIWDTFLIGFIFLNTLLLPLNICFELDDPTLNSLEIFMVYFLVIDIILSLFTAYYSKGVIITNQNKIIRNYLSNMLLWDCLSVLPYFLNPFLQYDYIKLFIMFRLLKMKKIFKGIEEHLFLSNKIKGVYDLIKLMVLIIYVSHFFACAWVYIALSQIKHGAYNTWIQNFNLIDSNWQEQYISSLYFAVYTMVTVGYGDIYAVNIVERALCIMFMIIACGVFAYSLNRFGTILQEMYQQETDFKSLLNDFTHYMRIRKVDKALQMRIKRYMEYMHDENISGFHRGEGLLEYISPRLKNELMENIYAKYIMNISILKNNFSTAFLKKLSLKFEEKTYSPEDIIYEKGDIDNLGLYYIVKGNVCAFLEKKEKTLQTFKNGEFFGEYSFFSDKPHEISIKSDQVTHIAFISRREFVALLSNYEEDFEKFHTIKEMINSYNNKSLLKNACPSCLCFDHFISECPMLNMNFKRKQIIETYKHDSFNERLKIIRVPKKSHNARVNIRAIQEKAKPFEQYGLSFCNSSEEDYFLYDENQDNFSDELDDKSSDMNNQNENLEIQKELNAEITKHRCATMKMIEYPRKSLKKRTFSPKQYNKQIEWKNLTNLEEEKINDEKIHINQDYSLDKNKLTFDTFAILTRNLEKPPINSEKSKNLLISDRNLDKISRFPSTSQIKDQISIEKIEKKNSTSQKNHHGNISLEDFMPFLERKSSVKREKNNMENEQIKENKQSLLEDFDKMKTYKIFFIHNNVENILARISNLRIQEKYPKKSRKTVKKKIYISSQRRQRIDSGFRQFKLNK